MKQVVYLFFLLISFVYGFSSCMSSSSEGAMPYMSNGEPISIQVAMPDQPENIPDARVAFHPSDLSLTWQAGDQLAIIGYNGSQVVGKSILTLSSGANAADGVFEGYSVKGAVNYNIVYPASLADAQGNVSVTYSNQVQNGNDDAAHLRNYLILQQTGGKVSAENLDASKQDIPMQLLNSILKFQLTGLPDGITSLSGIQWNTGKNPIHLGIGNVDVSATHSFTGYLCFSDMDVPAGGSFNVFLEQPGSQHTANASYQKELTQGKKYEPNHLYTASISQWIVDHKVYYTSNVKLTEDMFTPQPKSGSGQWSSPNGSYAFSKAPAIKHSNTVTDKITSLDIKGIQSILKEAFKGASALKSITLHPGLQSIGVSAFNGCKVLTSVTIPEGVTEIGNLAFAYCDLLDNVSVPASVNLISNQMFRGCKSLKNIMISEGVQKIDANAFNGCETLTQLNLPASINLIGNAAFANCNKLKELVVNAQTPPTIDSSGTNNPLGIKDGLVIKVPAASLKDYQEKWPFYSDKLVAMD